MVQETSFKRQQYHHKPANESNSISCAGLANVYIEITHDNMKSSCLYCAFHDKGNQQIKIYQRSFWINKWLLRYKTPFSLKYEIFPWFTQSAFGLCLMHKLINDTGFSYFLTNSYLLAFFWTYGFFFKIKCFCIHLWCLFYVIIATLRVSTDVKIWEKPQIQEIIYDQITISSYYTENSVLMREYTC